MAINENSKQAPTWSPQVGACCVSDCERRAEKRGYCSAHYQRLRKYGDATAGGPVRSWTRQSGDATCTAADCSLVSRKRSWCMKHYERWLKYGSADSTPTPRGHKRRNSSGYILAHSGGCAPIEFEHRLMWEAKFGTLLPGQNIHHKNGDRSDNRYENLELWDTTQPAGQRPEDKVEFALQMLRRYAPDLLVDNS